MDTPPSCLRVSDFVSINTNVVFYVLDYYDKIRSDDSKCQIRAEIRDFIHQLLESTSNNTCITNITSNRQIWYEFPKWIHELCGPMLTSEMPLEKIGQTRVVKIHYDIRSYCDQIDPLRILYWLKHVKVPTVRKFLLAHSSQYQHMVEFCETVSSSLIDIASLRFLLETLHKRGAPFDVFVRRIKADHQSIHSMVIHLSSIQREVLAKWIMSMVRLGTITILSNTFYQKDSNYRVFRIVMRMDTCHYIRAFDQTAFPLVDYHYGYHNGNKVVPATAYRAWLYALIADDLLSMRKQNLYTDPLFQKMRTLPRDLIGMVCRFFLPDCVDTTAADLFQTLGFAPVFFEGHDQYPCRIKPMCRLRLNRIVQGVARQNKDMTFLDVLFAINPAKRLSSLQPAKKRRKY